MQATIEIDLGPLSDEWEAVAWRVPKKGDHYFWSKSVQKAHEDHTGEERLIVRRKWVWPSWLKARWYAEDANGWQFAYIDRPRLGEREWLPSNKCLLIDSSLLDIPKIGGDWKQSLRENPNWEGES